MLHSIVRKIVTVFGVYASLSAVFLILYWSGFSFCKNEKLVAPSFIVLLGGFVVFLHSRWNDFIKRLILQRNVYIHLHRRVAGKSMRRQTRRLRFVRQWQSVAEALRSR